MNLPKCTDIGDSAFEDCTMQKIVLNSATNLGSNVFKNCKNLEMIYAPKVKGFDECSGCTNLNLVFVPTAKDIDVAIPNNATIYCSDKLTSINFDDEYSDYKCTIVSPEYTPGLVKLTVMDTVMLIIISSVTILHKALELKSEQEITVCDSALNLMIIM